VSAAPVVGAVDIGTNSTRLAVGGERRATITRLGHGVDRTGRLDDAAVERTLEVLRDFATVLGAHGADRVRAVATSAARDAANRDAFFDAAEAILGTRPELLSGE
jgi:exopolyphosphatase/guanosine-5'-triphosphate,3'-diphosphate pyrophosphatase